METERVYQEKTARTIRPLPNGSRALQFVDNRPVNQLLQRIGHDKAWLVESTTEVAGMPVNDNAALEHEADVMGAKAVQMKSIGVQEHRLKNVGNKNSEPIKQFYNKSMKTVRFPIQRVVDLVRDSYTWKTPDYLNRWHRGKKQYEPPTPDSRAVTTAVSDELGDGAWISGHMINGTLAGGHGRPDNIEPITSGLNHSMTTLENRANAAAEDPTLEYKYMMQGVNTHTWSRTKDWNHRVTNLITEYQGTLSTRTCEYVTPGRIERDQLGQYVRIPPVITPPGPVQNLVDRWQMAVRPGITES